MFYFSLDHYRISYQVAALINEHNRLSRKRSPSDVQLSRVSYVVETHGNLVLGAVGVDRQGYTFTEIKHLVVRPDWRGKGIARHLLKRALSMANTRMLYATIREDNIGSLRLFESCEFVRAGEYSADNHKVLVLVRTNPQWKKTRSDSKLRWFVGENGMELQSRENL